MLDDLAGVVDAQRPHRLADGGPAVGRLSAPRQDRHTPVISGSHRSDGHVEPRNPSPRTPNDDRELLGTGELGVRWPLWSTRRRRTTPDARDVSGRGRRRRSHRTTARASANHWPERLPDASPELAPVTRRRRRVASARPSTAGPSPRGDLASHVWRTRTSASTRPSSANAMASSRPNQRTCGLSPGPGLGSASSPSSK